MCYTEDSILTAADNDHRRKKAMYEKMGDGSCCLKNYSKGIEYYEKMLAEAELCGDRGKDLSPCYVSLAQTYRDNRQYDLAIEFFKKEYEICKNDIEESVNTLYNIVDTLALNGGEVDSLCNIYVQTRKKCSFASERHLEGKTLKRHANLLRKHKRVQEAIALERELAELNFVSSDDENGESQDNNTPNIGEDVDTDDITG